jgi:biofilm PGA synthesis lipoprotein PgaB
MTDPARPGLSRRRFLALGAAAAAVPVLGGCTGAAGPATAELVPALSPQVPGARAANSVRDQLATPLTRQPEWARGMGQGPQALGAGAPDHLLILSYHDVTADGLGRTDGRADHYTVSAVDFAAQMQMLTSSGFRTVRISDVVRSATSGVPLPARSVLITFDDGGAGQWIFADRVLADLGLHAVAFLITGHLGSSAAYLSWPEAQALARSGRWDIQAHTHDQHHFVPTGPLTAPASVLINRVWDPLSRALEPPAAARARVAADLATGLDLLERHGLGRPDAFAYPFSQVDQPTNDPAFAAGVAEVLASRFALRLSNTSPGRLALPEDLRRGALPRLEVQHGVTALDLFDRIRAADTPRGSDHSTGGQAGG